MNDKALNGLIEEIRSLNEQRVQCLETGYQALIDLGREKEKWLVQKAIHEGRNLSAQQGIQEIQKRLTYLEGELLAEQAKRLSLNRPPAPSVVQEPAPPVEEVPNPVSLTLPT